MRVAHQSSGLRRTLWDLLQTPFNAPHMGPWLQTRFHPLPQRAQVLLDQLPNRVPHQQAADNCRQQNPAVRAGMAGRQTVDSGQ